MAKNQKRSGKSSTSAKKGTKARKPKRTAGRKQRQGKRSTGSKPRVARKTKKSGKNSGYNVYMKKTLSQIKTDSPSITHKEAFKKAAQNWSVAPENPNNQHE